MTVEYSKDIPYRNFLIATRDEIAIEAELYHGISAKRFVPEFKAALAMIDDAKEAGTYTRLREQLLATIPEARMPLFKIDENHAPNWENLMANLNSTDPVRRDRFERLFTQLEDRGFNDALVKPVLSTLERAPKKVGRKRVYRVPWEGVILAMDFIRREMAKGKLKGHACNGAAIKYPPAGIASGTLEYDQKLERVKRLTKLFNKKMVLRK